MTQQAEPSSPWITYGPYTIHENYPQTGYIKAAGLPGPFQVSVSTIITLESTMKTVSGEFVCFFDTLEEAKTFFLQFKAEGSKHKADTE